ncbi:MAG: sulfatase [Thermoanaerobaculia bacterium]
MSPRPRALSSFALAMLLASILLAFAAWAAVPAAGPPLRRDTPPRINILFIVADDQRADSLGVAGNPVLLTPALDRLASEGTRFTNNFCSTSICAVSRASLLTGQWARRHGVNDFTTPLGESAFAETYPALLRRAGYVTGFVGKWGVGAPIPSDQFDFWAGYDGQGDYTDAEHPEHLTPRLTEQGLQFLRQAREPFNLTISYKAPHAQDGADRPYPPEPRDEGLYRSATIPIPQTLSDAAFQALPAFLRSSEGRVRFLQRFASAQAFQDNVRDYDRLVTGLDRGVGQLLAELEARGVAGRTLVVFTSDNGVLLGEHGLADKWFMYEEAIRTPLVIRWPDASPALRGRAVEAMTLNVDLAPTLLDAAGVPIPDRMQGRSLRPLIEGTTVTWRSDWYYEHDVFTGAEIPSSEGVRGMRFKYVRYVEEPVYEQLFDLVLDRFEERDLLHTAVAVDPDRPRINVPGVLRSMRARWRELRAELR